MSDATTTPPPLPYTVRETRVGPGEGKPVLHRVYPGDVPGDFLSDDEARVWEYLRAAEAERSRLADEVAALKLRLADAEAELAGAVPHPTDAAAAMGGAKKGKGAK